MTNIIILQGIPTWDPSIWTHNMPNVSMMSTAPTNLVCIIKIISVCILCFKSIKSTLLAKRPFKRPARPVEVW